MTHWSLLTEQLRKELDPEEFKTWFGPLQVYSEDSNNLIITAPNSHFVHFIEQSYRSLIDSAISKVSKSDLDVCFRVEDDSKEQKSEAKDLQPPSSKFDPRYRFSNFVVGNSNQFCHAAARAIADSPSNTYNPFFLYGGVGLGKTHLMHAIGHAINSEHSNLHIMYLTAEHFVNDLINSIRYDRMPAFREIYRTIDVLLIDDIQFIANKERTQEEFFHTFNTLYTRQKQIILSSDASPREIPTIEERLRSRFEWGLIADIQPPEFETKVAILRKKAEDEKIDLPDEVANFIADKVKSNIRELEGLLNRVLAYSSLTGRKLSLQLAKDTLRDILPKNRLTANEIVKFAARHYGLKVSQIKSKNNSKHIAFPRQVAMYLCKNLTNLSYPDIGKHFNDKHHSTVIHSVKKISNLRLKDPDFDKATQKLLDHFK